MRIRRLTRSRSRARKAGADISRMSALRRNAGRVCGKGCAFKCSRCGSTECQCRCSPMCPQAGRELSADPDRYPIEPGILPLVFEMKRLRLFEPCWSCEGHLAANDSLQKTPEVWFYCSSTIYLRLLRDALSLLRITGRLNAPWEVVVTFSDLDNPDTTFSLQPAAAPDRALSLPALRQDIGEIAKSLEGMMRDGARALCHHCGCDAPRAR